MMSSGLLLAASTLGTELTRQLSPLVQWFSHHLCPPRHIMDETAELLVVDIVGAQGVAMEK